MEDDGNRVFKKITNNDIYDEIKNIQTLLQTTTKKTEKHEVHIERLWWAVGVLITLAIGTAGTIAAMR